MFLIYKIGAGITYVAMVADTWLNQDLSIGGNIIMNLSVDIGWAALWPVTWALCLLGL